MTPSLAAWENFYVIIGSSAAALTGLMFVVIALISEVRRSSSGLEIDAFGTPTVVHFCAAFLVSAVLSAPWRALASVSVVLVVLGTAGVVYLVIVVRRQHRQTGYQPVLEDWLWHAIFPFISYATIAVAATRLARSPTPALFGVGAASVLLLFIGIHNAWDTVTYMTLERLRRQNEPKD